MNVYTCVDHEGMWVGVASVVVAKDEDEARELLVEELKKQDLHDDGSFTLKLVDTSVSKAIILQNGDY